MPEKLYREAGASEYLIAKCGIGARRSLAKWRVTGFGPKFRRLGRTIVYAREDLDAWIASRLSGPLASTSDRAEAA